MSKIKLDGAEIWKKQETHPNLGLTENNLLIEEADKLLKKVTEEKIINYIEFKLTPIGDSKNSNSESKFFKVSMFAILNKEEEYKEASKGSRTNEKKLKEPLDTKSYGEINHSIKDLFFNERPGDNENNLNSIFRWMQESSFNEIMLSAKFLFLPEKKCNPHLPKGFLERSKLSKKQLEEVNKYLIKRNNQLQKITTELMKFKKNKAKNKIIKVEKKISPY